MQVDSHSSEVERSDIIWTSLKEIKPPLEINRLTYPGGTASEIDLIKGQKTLTEATVADLIV